MLVKLCVDKRKLFVYCLQYILLQLVELFFFVEQSDSLRFRQCELFVYGLQLLLREFDCKHHIFWKQHELYFRHCNKLFFCFLLCDSDDLSMDTLII